MNDLAKIERVSRCLKAMAHPVRLAILCTLREGEQTVQQLESGLGTSQSMMSQHLGNLRDRGILTSRREGNQTYYRVASEAVFLLLEQLEQVFCKTEAAN